MKEEILSLTLPPADQPDSSASMHRTARIVAWTRRKNLLTIFQNIIVPGNLIHHQADMSQRLYMPSF